MGKASFFKWAFSLCLPSRFVKKDLLNQKKWKEKRMWTENLLPSKKMRRGRPERRMDSVILSKFNVHCFPVAIFSFIYIPFLWQLKG